MCEHKKCKWKSKCFGQQKKWIFEKEERKHFKNLKLTLRSTQRIKLWGKVKIFEKGYNGNKMVFLEANKLRIKIMFRVARFKQKKCFDVNRKEEKWITTKFHKRTNFKGWRQK